MTDLLTNLLQPRTVKKKKPKGVKLSRTTGSKYNAQLQSLITEIKRDIDVSIMPLLVSLAPQYQTDSTMTKDSYIDQIVAALNSLLSRWSSPDFEKQADTLASQFVRTANRANQDGFNRDFGIDIFSDPDGLSDYLDISAFENANLIKSIPQQYLGQVQAIVTQNVRTGQRPAVIAKQLEERFGVSQSRAKFIARDQTAKINGDLSAMRQQAVGMTKFRWVTSKDSRVRDRHRAISRRKTDYGVGVYRWDDLPKNEKGVPIKPGDDYQCRCVAVPVVD